jgi:hypothetical protein
MEIHGDLSAETLSSYFKHVSAEITAEIRWYKRKRKEGRFLTTSLRTLAVTAAAAGILLPLMENFAERIARGLAWLFGVPAAQITGAEAAYISLAFGAVLLLIDQVFVVTSGWVRYMITELKLKAALSDLEFEWAERFPRVVAGEGGADEAKAALAALRKARVAANEIVEAETRTWASELDRAKVALSEKINREG